jgi:hypothetical protein
MSERGDGYQAGYADAMRRVRQALHEGFVREHPDTTGCVLVPDGGRAERLLCRLFAMSAPAGGERPSAPPTAPKTGLRLLRGGRRG